MRDPVLVAFATQKGGAGKSTLTTLVASYLYYLEGLEVVAVDCDSSQHSMKVYRDHDLLVTNENPYLKKSMARFYSKFQKKAYDILLSSPEEAFDVAMDYIDKGNSPDVIFFDITGTINDPSIVRLIATMDYIFVPITLETGDMTSSVSFANHVHNRMVTTGKTNIKGLHLVWNKIDPREQPRLCEIVNEYAAKLGFSSLETMIRKSNKFMKDGLETGKGGIFRSTMLPPTKQLIKGTNLDALVKEIRSIIQV